MFLFIAFYFNKFISYDIQNINSKKSSLDLQSEENELINHLGLYKSDSLNSIISPNRSFDLIGRRKNSF